jgi:CAAX protease family protein
VLTPFDHALAVVLAAVFPLLAVLFGTRRLRRAPEDRRTGLRRRVYLRVMVVQWATVAALVVLWVARARTWDELGLVPHAGRGLVAMAIVVAAAAVVLLAQLRAARRSDASLERVADRVRGFEAMLPHDARDLDWFRAVALTAGVCEELLYRGFLFWYAAHWLSPVGALAASSVAFGLGHAYQGWRGVLGTTGVGALLAVVYVVSGSLHLGMLAHMLLDLHAGVLTQAAHARVDALARARAAAQAATSETAESPGPPGEGVA